MERNFAPVIVFSFSKKDCEAYALQMAKLEFNTKVPAAFFVKSKIARLHCYYFQDTQPHLSQSGSENLRVFMCRAECIDIVELSRL